VAECAAVGKGPANFLLDWHEETWYQSKCGEPQCNNRLEVLFTKSDLADFEERIRRESGDEQTNSDGNGSFGKGSL
jgi:hypothetical protein